MLGFSGCIRMGFLSGGACNGVEYAIFYGVAYGFILWVLQAGLLVVCRGGSGQFSSSGCSGGLEGCAC